MKFLNLFSRLSTLVISAISLASAISPDDLSAPYLGTKVLRIPTSNETSIIQYTNLVEKFDLDVWTEGFKKDSHVDVAVTAEDVDEVTSAVDAIRESLGIAQPIIVMHEDLGESIKTETGSMFTAKTSDVEALVDISWFNNYHTYNDHISWFNELAASYPNNSRIVSAGTSIQGRDLMGIHIYGSSSGKPALVYHSTVHAREWITTMVNEYMAYMLLTSSEGRAYLEDFDFYVFPFVNPDGFVYTQTSDRLWRKNRHTPPSGSSCYGVDVNRNWPHSSWGQNGGASTSPCSQTYKGSSSASEIETRAWVSYINRINNVVGYMDWHSYSQLAMTPYGYSCNINPPDLSEHNSISAGFANAVRAVHGSRFDYGPICTTIYQVSGASVDWAYDNANIKYSYTVELRDTGRYGFILPENQILASGEEIWAGLKYMWGRFA